MARPTEKDIKRMPEGSYHHNQDGRHLPSWHKYLYYTKKEVMRLWRESHPRTGEAK